MISIGDPIPSIELPNQDNERIHLRDFQGAPLVIFSFPQAGTTDCTLQACTYRDAYEQFAELNTRILGVSASSPRTLKAWHREHDLPFDLLADEKHRLLDALGGWGHNIIGILDLPFAKRSFWIFDADGILRGMQFNVDPVTSIEDSVEYIQQIIEKQEE